MHPMRLAARPCDTSSGRALATVRHLPAVFALIAALLPAPAKAADATAETSPFDSLESRTVTRIDVSGHRVTKEYVIRREIEVAPGAPYRQETMKADLQR